MTLQTIIDAFETEFEPFVHKFELIKLLDDNFNLATLSYEHIQSLKLPSDKRNIVWHPGVYVFFANGRPYRIGRHLTNSRDRVVQHLKACTGIEGSHNVWHIRDYPDGQILLFNLKKQEDRHWAAALEIFLENKFKHDLAIPAKRH